MPWTGFVKSKPIIMENIRVEFNVSEITEYGNDGGRRVILLPVLNNSEENKKVLGDNPNGKIVISITDPDIKLEMGKYYIDFVKVK